MELILLSPRLRMTPLSVEDFDLSMALFADPEVVKYAGAPMTEAAIRNELPAWVRRGGNGCIGIWTISDRETSEKYGSVALLPMPIDEKKTDYSLLVPGKMPDGHIEIGYFLKRSAWGNGYATEACRRLLRFAFEQTPLQEVLATFDKNNLVSKKVLLKAGFTDRGTMRSYGNEGVIFRITRQEWSEQQAGQAS